MLWASPRAWARLKGPRRFRCPRARHRLVTAPHGAGLDVILLVALAGTGYFALRRFRYLATAAAAAATLLVVDAWFDVMTTLPGQRLEPLALAAGVEVPLAAVCFWLSLHTQQLAERRLVLLLHRGPKTEAGSH